MYKRLWPAWMLAGALLLAATSLLATDDQTSAGFQTIDKTRGSTMRPGVPAPAPVTSPGEPGDDDMPDRTSRPRGTTMGGSNSVLLSQDQPVQSWRVRDLKAGLRWYLVRVLLFVR